MSDKLRSIAHQVDGIGRSAIVQLEKAGYERLIDLAYASNEELSEVDGIGPTTANRLLDYADQKGIKVKRENTIENAKPSETENRLSVSQLKNRLEKYYKEDKMDNRGWYHCQRTREDGTVCNKKIYFSNNNPADLRRHEATHDSVNEKPEPVLKKELSDENTILDDIESEFDIEYPE